MTQRFMQDEMYILYGEGSEEDAFIMRDMLNLQQPDSKLHVVSNGFEILNHLQEVKDKERYPSLIILNIEMPYLKGKQTLELLKTDDIYRLIPVIMLSDKEDFEDGPFYEGLNTEVYVKPSSFSEWKSMIAKVCKHCQ
jgi:two-component system, response regulator